MNAIVHQDSGLGDILFLQKVGSLLCSEFDKVFWPVVPQYSYVSEYLETPKNLFFTDPAPGERLTEFHLQEAAKHFPYFPVMEAKYRMARIESNNWRRYVHVKQNREKQKALQEIIDAPGSYALVCNEYATPPETFKVKIEPTTTLPIVHIGMLEGFTPFDWMRIIANAEELHFVDTVFTFLVEIMEVRAKKMRLYVRAKHENKILTKELWSKPWEFVE